MTRAPRRAPRRRLARASTSACSRDPATPSVDYRNDAQRSPRRSTKGDADAASCCAPVTVEQIRAAAAAGVRMPEKTTFFAPKPRTGMVFRSLDD